MAFLTVNTDENVIRDYTGGGGKFINQPGIYEVIIKHLVVEVGDKGSQVVNFYFEYQDQPQFIFQGARITNNDGSKNEYGYNMMTKLAIIAGCKNGQDIDDPVSCRLPIGKNGEEKECMVLEQFNDLPVFIRIGMEYDLYNEKLQMNRKIRNFYRYTDKATASEIVNNTEAGNQYEVELAHAEEDKTYKKDLTPEIVEKMLKEQRSSKEPKEEPKKPLNGFGSKRFGQAV